MVPKTFREAWEHQNEYKRGKWRETIRQEFYWMIQNMMRKRNGMNTPTDERI